MSKHIKTRKSDFDSAHQQKLSIDSKANKTAFSIMCKNCHFRN